MPTPVIYQLIVAEQRSYDLIEQASQPHFGLVHAFYAIMGGFAFYGPYGDNNPTIKESLFEISTNPRHTIDIPTFHTVVYIMEHFPHIITDITEEYILDRAASSSLSKAVLIVQVAWFCTNCASRLFQHLPLSLLEVSTAAHAFCTLLTYFVWWSKPNNVAAPTLMREKEAQEAYALLKCSDEEYDEALEIARKRAAGDSSAPTGPHESAKIVLAANALQHLLPNPKRPQLQQDFQKRYGLLPGTGRNYAHHANFFVGITAAISPIVYGLVHCLAWSDKFPTPREQSLWRFSSVVITCSGLMFTFNGWVLSAIDNGCRTKALAVIIPIAHLLASGFLLVESLRQLLFLDPAAYQLPSWSNYWPHLS